MVESCYITRWGRGHCMQSNGILRMVVERPKSSQTKLQLEADWWLVYCHTASYCSASGKKSLVPARQGQKCGISMWLTECNLGKTKGVKSLYVSLKWFVPTCNMKPRFQPHCSLPTDLCGFNMKFSSASLQLLWTHVHVESFGFIMLDKIQNEPSTFATTVSATCTQTCVATPS